MDTNTNTNTTSTTIFFFENPPPFPDPPQGIDFSPLEYILGLLAVITIPALAYAFFFTIPCPLFRRRTSPTSDAELAATPSVATPSEDTSAVEGAVKFHKDDQIGSECPVCLSVFDEGEEIKQLSACRHAFHVSCIEMWLVSHSNCPVCRATVPVKRSSSDDSSRNSSSSTTSSGNNNRRRESGNRDDDMHQGLPDATSLV